MQLLHPSQRMLLQASTTAACGDAAFLGGISATVPADMPCEYKLPACRIMAFLLHCTAHLYQLLQLQLVQAACEQCEGVAAALSHSAYTCQFHWQRFTTKDAPVKHKSTSMLHCTAHLHQLLQLQLV
jgi:hypothetical protein